MGMYLFLLTIMLTGLFLKAKILKHNNLFYKNNKDNNMPVKASNEDRETYFATLIHDLKTPAFAQIRTMDLLLKGYFGNLTSTQKEIIKETLASEKYMAELVSNILTSYKCREKSLKLQISCFDVTEVLDNIYCSVKSLADANNQTISINYHCTNLFCCADKLQITRVMTNFVSNAIKYGFKNSLINVNLDINSEELDFNVENYSQPIPEEKLSKIYEKFTGGLSHYNSASTGLGLYLSKQIIELHNGKVYAKSFENGRCVFGFKLPLNLRDKSQNKRLQNI